jgi:hypothetical protein
MSRRPLGIVFAITMPFYGVLVRYRANYTPKRGVQLRDEDGSAADTPSSDTPNSYFQMMKRVHRVEGWAGLYKGLSASSPYYSSSNPR